MVMLAARPDRPLSTREVAEELRVSEAHLSKVLQRLAKAGLVNSTRGPHGGFVLAHDAHDISLLEVYETIDGPICTADCLLNEPTCEGQACIMGDLVKSVNEQMRRYLSDTHLDEVTEVYAKRQPTPVPA
jgi:Rrf2 family protein